MINHYLNSWRIYKEHTKNFNEDRQYYLDFCRGHRTLELFAGFGRLTNYLFANSVDIESVELEKNFAKFIKIPKDKNHICDVLHFKPKVKFERIFAAYNSFCLLTNEKNVLQFFKNLDSWVLKNGLISLSYYHPNAWESAKGIESNFIYLGNNVKHISRFDLSKRNEGLGIWFDEYHYNAKREICSYPTKI
jgi:hypothetical protein